MDSASAELGGIKGLHDGSPLEVIHEELAYAIAADCVLAMLVIEKSAGNTRLCFEEQVFLGIGRLVNVGVSFPNKFAALQLFAFEPALRPDDFSE